MRGKLLDGRMRVVMDRTQENRTCGKHTDLLPVPASVSLLTE